MEVRIKLNLEVVQNLNKKMVNLKSIIIVFGGDNQKDCDNYIIKSYIMKDVFKKYLNLHYQLLMRNVFI